MAKENKNRSGEIRRIGSWVTQVLHHRLQESSQPLRTAPSRVDWYRIETEDLTSDRVFDLFDHAVEIGVVDGSEDDLHFFVAAAEHAMSGRNPPGFSRRKIF